MTRQLAVALSALALLTFAAVWAVVHYSFIYIGGRGFDLVKMVERPVIVPVGDAERLQMKLHMVYGDLRLSSGTVGALTGSARYNVMEFAPRILYEVEGRRGRLLMDHLMEADNTRLINRRGRINQWQLVLNDQVAIDELEVVVGLGSAQIDLRDVNLRHATMALLSGDFTVDLRGNWQQSSLVEIDGLNGAIEIRLPTTTGALVMVDGIPATLHVTGLTELATQPSLSTLPTAAVEQWDLPQNAQGEMEYETSSEAEKYYANSTYQEGATNLYLQVTDAFGTLTLIAEEPQ